ncbi:MAG: major capsid protein, partial [Micromonosporaceae bacterium]
MPKTTSGGVGDAGAPFTLPADLSNLSVEQLDELRGQADTELDAILDGGRRSEDLPRFTQLAKAIKTIDGRKAEIQAEIEKTNAEYEAMLADIRPQTAPDEPGSEDDDTPAEPDAPVVVEGEVLPAAPQLVSASSRPSGGAVTASRDTGGLSGPKHRLNPSLSGAKAVAPKVEAPSRELAITASVGLPGKFEPGAKLTDLRAVGDLMETRARSMADAGGRYAKRRPGDPYGGVQVASIANDWIGEDRFNDATGAEAVQTYIDKINGSRNAGKFETLVAGGGWCAPSENRYDFFNIACQGGMIDLPTFGVTRGGINFPVSPSLADTFSPALPWYTAFSNATVPWLWTETDDILTVTGSTNKPCIRVPCSDMT